MPRFATTRAVCLAAAAVLALLLLSVAEAGASPYVLYSDDIGAQEWRDYSWDARLVDFRSGPGFDGASAIDAAIQGYGAFALARVKLPADADANAKNADDGDSPDSAASDEPAYVAASDPLAARLTMQVQGPLKSARKLATRDNDNDDEDGQWLFLTDGRVLPKVANRLTVKTVPKYARPASLNDIVLYFEDSESGRASAEVLLSRLVAADVSERMRTHLVDDSAWTELEVDISPLLQASGMTQWDKLVLKDAGGKGFNIRLDTIELRGPKPGHEEREEAQAPLDGGRGSEDVASVYAKGQAPLPSSEKAIHNWLSEGALPASGGDMAAEAEEDAALSQSDARVVHRNALQAFQEAEKCKMYSSPVNIASIQDGGLKEPSGLAASRRYRGILWTHQDRDTSPYLYAVEAKTGQVVGKYYVSTRQYSETDWEDISVALCPDGSGDHCLWIADSGNVRRDREAFFVHVFKEPDLEAMGKYGTIEDWDIWTFAYQLPLDRHGERPWIDIESLVVAPDASKFWLVEKTVYNGGEGPVTVWETPADMAPTDLVRSDSDSGKNVLFDLTQRGHDAVWDHPEMLIEMKLVNRIKNPRIQRATAFLRPENFDPPLPQWAEEKYREGGQDWNKLRAITGVDLHPSGKALVACTYSGIWEYPLSRPYDLSSASMGEPRLLSVTSKYDDPFWQTEAIAYDSAGDGIWLASEYVRGHQPLRFFGCRDAVTDPNTFLE